MSLNTHLKDQPIYATLGQGDDAEGRFQNEKLQASNSFLNSHMIFVLIYF